MSSVLPNPTLKDHKLLFVTPIPLSRESLADIHERFPDLEITTHIQDWLGEDEETNPLPAPEEIWREVTILITGNLLPTKQQTPKLKYVQLTTAGTGYAVCHPLFQNREVVFCSTSGMHCPQITEWVFSTYLAFEHEVRWHRVPGSSTNNPVNRRVGILGYGAIGRQIARGFYAMGMDIYAYTFNPRITHGAIYKLKDRENSGGVIPAKWFSGTSTAELHAFLDSDLDLLVIATPLTKETYNLISKHEFEILGRKRTFVSNVSPGPIINTDALVEALEHGIIRGAAMNLTDPEPLPEVQKLQSARNLIITPHVSGSTSLYMKRLMEIVIQNLKLLGEGKELLNRVDRGDEHAYESGRETPPKSPYR